MDLSTLVPMLKAQGVQHFEGYGIKVSFHKPTQSQTTDIPVATLDEINKELDQASKVLSQPQQQPPQTAGAPDLRADDAMSYDQVLNWSVGGEGSLPLTGEESGNA